MKIKLQNLNKGFTLIEVLVVVAVTGILMTLASVIFINTIRNSKKAEITSEARQIGALVIDRLQKDARDAENFDISGDGETLTINKTDSSTVVWVCVLDAPDNDYITRNSVSITNRDIVDGVSVDRDDCGFSPAGGTGLNLVNFTVTLTEGVGVQSSSQEYQVEVPFVTSISARNF